MGPEPQPSAERPLSRGRLLALGLSAGSLILVFYLFAVASVIVLATLLGIEMVLFTVLLRFGMSRLLVDPMKRHLAILRMYFTWSPWRSGGDGTIRIVRPDAPRLFDLLEQQSRALELAMADEVILGMSVNAWVRLQGYRRGAGRTTLGVGFDLLAGLSEREFEGVLAHELAHAKLIQRGFKRWLGAGLN